MDSEISSFRVLMFPWLAHGHIFPYLELAKRILKHSNFHIYLCTTAINFTSINQFIHQNLLQNSIEVVELHLEPTPSLPPHYHTTKNLPPHLNFTLLKAFQTARSSFSDIITNLKPHLIMYDSFQPWAASLASSRGIPAVHYAPLGAAATSFSHHHYARWDEHFPFPELNLNDHEKKSFDSLVQFLHFNILDQDKDVAFVNYRLSHEVVVLKTSKGFEGKYIDYVSSVTNKRILAVGPLVTDADQTEEESSEMLQWLSRKKQNPTLYISFGSEYFLSE